MTAARDVRPLSQHRQSLSGLNGPRATSTSRQHSHSMSLGSLNTGRVNRRKSSFTGVNVAALTAAHENNTLMRPISSGDGLGIAYDKSSAVVDGPALGQMKTKTPRGRRASEGSRLIRERRKSLAGELRCETCGKGYKHGSCLQKHLWEHTPEWALTSKLLISKHAQVQLLEAASVLVNMSDTGAVESSESSHSPASVAVDDDDENDQENSSRTSTPSQDGEDMRKSYRQPRRQDSYSSIFSRSLGSTAASSVPTESYLRPWSSRPSTAYSHDDPADVTTAAEGLVSCSISTPQYRPVRGLDDVPPVPPLPAKFAAHASPYLLPADADASDEERKYRRDDEYEGVFGRMEQ